MPLQGIFRLGYIGRLEKDSGIRTLVKALDTPRDRVPQTCRQVGIGGKGTMEQETEAATEQQRIGGASLLSGAMQQSALVYFYNIMHVFMFHYRDGQRLWSQSGLEAMA